MGDTVRIDQLFSAEALQEMRKMVEKAVRDNLVVLAPQAMLIMEAGAMGPIAVADDDLKRGALYQAWMQQVAAVMISISGEMLGRAVFHGAPDQRDAFLNIMRQIFERAILAGLEAEAHTVRVINTQREAANDLGASQWGKK